MFGILPHTYFFELYFYTLNFIGYTVDNVCVSHIEYRYVTPIFAKVTPKDYRIIASIMK